MTISPCPTSRLAALLLCITATAVLAQAPSTRAEGTWVATWAASPQSDSHGPGSADLESGGITLREIIHTSAGGSQVRVHLSNLLGQHTLTLGPMHVALAGDASAVQPGSDHSVLFNGKPTVDIPAGAVVISDAVAMTLPALSSVAVSIFVPARVDALTVHSMALQTSYKQTGNAVDAAVLAAPQPISNWVFLTELDTMTGPGGGTVLAYGDSITDGAASLPNTNGRWPDELARRLQTTSATRNFAVANQGISGNRVLHDDAFENALKRFDRDVLATPGLAAIIVLEGINDIGRTVKPNLADDAINAEQLNNAFSQMILRAHLHHVRIIGATILPDAGAGYYGPAGEEIRQKVNTWIRTSGQFDAVADLDAVIRDPAHPEKMRAEFDSGDHLHPNPAGLKAMGDAIDLTQLHQ